MKLKIFNLSLLLISVFISYCDNKDLYLDLMKKCLLNSIYEDVQNPNYNSSARENGLDWPNVAHTMIGLKRLNNLQFCLEDVIKNNVPGDFIETGVWRGGACIFARSIFKAYNIADRNVWVADSFAGLPEPTLIQDLPFACISASNCSYLAISEEQVKANFAKYGLLDSQVKFAKGFFKDTLHKIDIKQISVLRLDGDYYESTMDALNALYDKVSIGGYIIVDDYHALDACSKAINDFRRMHDIQDQIYEIDGTGTFWQKTK